MQNVPIVGHRSIKYLLSVIPILLILLPVLAGCSAPLSTTIRNLPGTWHGQTTFLQGPRRGAVELITVIFQRDYTLQVTVQSDQQQYTGYGQWFPGSSQTELLYTFREPIETGEVLVVHQGNIRGDGAVMTLTSLGMGCLYQNGKPVGETMALTETRLTQLH